MAELIFLIDDDATYNSLNKRMLKKQLDDQYEIQEFTDPEEALTKILEENVVPTYIFLDVNMPLMDGWEFLQILQEETESSDFTTKICMLTSSIFPADREKAFKFNYVFNYVNKPLDPVSMSTIFG